MSNHSLTLTETDSPGFLPLAVSGVHSSNLNAAVASLGIAHPYPTLSHAWYAVVTAMHAVLDALEARRAASTTADKSKAERDLMTAYRDTLYRSAEFVESIDVCLSRLGKSAQKTFAKVPKSLDRALSEQCNVLKHEGGRFCQIVASHTFIEVVGYQLQQVIGAGVQQVERVHKSRPSFSFNVELRRLLTNLYLAGDVTGKAVIAEYGPALPLSNAVKSESARLVERISKLPTWAFSKEKASDMPTIKFDGTTLEMTQSGGAIVPLTGGGVTLSASFSADGFTRQYNLPKA